MPECPFCCEIAAPDDRFCGKCGAELMDWRPADQARETVPVMSAAAVRRKLGMVYYRKGNRQQALVCWAKSLELEPGDEETQALVARARSELRTETHGG